MIRLVDNYTFEHKSAKSLLKYNSKNSCRRSTKPDLQAATTTLALDDWKAELVAANTAFDTRYVDRSVDAGLASTNEDKVYNKRPEINTAYYELRNQIDGYYTVKKKAAPWSTVTAALNGQPGYAGRCSACCQPGNANRLASGSITEKGLQLMQTLSGFRNILYHRQHG